jgi:spoIIIJ-associated protein
MEWVEVQGKTVDVAVAAALDELGLSSADDASIEVLQEPKGGFLGMGGQQAIVKVSRKPKKRRRRRRSGRKPETEDAKKQTGRKPSSNRHGGNKRGSGKESSAKGSRSGASSGEKKPVPANSGSRSKETRSAGRPPRKNDSRPEAAPIETQAEVAKEFLAGLLDAFGLEGSVETRIEEDILYLDVTGDQTEALVGPRGTVIQAILELTRTVVQRKTYGAPRMRLDIAGYGERRRAALTIYASNLAAKVLAGGGEIMLEPMNAADRKVVHDAVTEISNVRSFSEGEDPHRAVVLAPEEGYTPPAAEDAESDVDAAVDAVEDVSATTGDDSTEIADHGDDEFEAETDPEASDGED